jgi:hypothetical protein
MKLQNLLLMYNLANTVKFPVSITHNTSSLMDVMITNNLNIEKQTVMYDLGYSDIHLAQTVYIKLDKPAVGPTAINKRQFTDNNTIEEFMHLLQEESWDEDFLSDDVNIFSG